MSELSDISVFMDQARVDGRVGPLHVSLYVALYYCWQRQGGSGPVEFVARELMPLAKIAGFTPFHRCLKQLHTYGYIVYEPSFNPAIKSRAFLPIHKGDGYGVE
jgi:hypothetical protein